MYFTWITSSSGVGVTYDKACHTVGSDSYRTTCNTLDNGSFKPGSPDATVQIEFHKRSTTCAKEPYRAPDFTKLTVDGTCYEFEKDGKTIYYKAVQTTETNAAKLKKPRKEGDPSEGAECFQNKIRNDKVTTNNDLRCFNMPDGSGPKICKNAGFDGGTFGAEKRPSADKAEFSNLCKSTCIDKGDVFCVSKSDLTSLPACCPKTCEDPGDSNENACSKTLKGLGDHICSDQISLARDEMKYLLCPPNDNMKDICGTKYVKFDTVKDKESKYTFKSPWYPAGSLDAPALSLTEQYTFPKFAICSYAFVIPEDA